MNRRHATRWGISEGQYVYHNYALLKKNYNGIIYLSLNHAKHYDWTQNINNGTYIIFHSLHPDKNSQVILDALTVNRLSGSGRILFAIIKEWVSFFWVHGEWIGVRDKQIAWTAKRFSDDLFVPRSDSFPMNPGKKTLIPYIYNVFDKTFPKTFPKTLQWPTAGNVINLNFTQQRVLNVRTIISCINHCV